MPPVWASPSRISEPGITGKPGKWSWRCSSARVTFLTALAYEPDLNSTTRSIQNQRMRGDLVPAPAGGRLPPSSSRELRIHELHDHSDREQVLDVLDLGVLGELVDVGGRQALAQLGEAGLGKRAVLGESGISGRKVVREQFAAGNLDVERLLQSKDDVQKVDRFGPEVAHQRGVHRAFGLVGPQRVDQD